MAGFFRKATCSKSRYGIDVGAYDPKDDPAAGRNVSRVFECAAEVDFLPMIWELIRLGYCTYMELQVHWNLADYDDAVEAYRFNNDLKRAQHDDSDNDK